MNNMENQKIFISSFINKLINKINNGSLDEYFKDTFEFPKDAVIISPKIVLNDVDLDLIDPDENKNDFVNAKKIFLSYKGLTPVQATDVRMWTYLSHVTFWGYMKKRWPLEKKNVLELKNNILSHWFIENLNAKSISRHGIAYLWWGAYLTYDETKNDPFLLTKEFFSYLEYTRSLFEISLGKNKNFMHSFLEFVIDNNDIFKENKENRIRFLMKKVNFLAGYKLITTLSREEVKNILSEYKEELKQIYGRQSDV